MSWLVSHGVQPDTVNDLRSGGAERDRTVDPLLAKQVLSQLSYSPIANYQRSGELTAKLVGLGRFELPTSPLSGVRSNQLSYRPPFGSGLSRYPGRYLPHPFKKVSRTRLNVRSDYVARDHRGKLKQSEKA